jgi:hypothetical protein
VSVERYHATLDAGKVTSFIRSEMAALQSPVFQRVLSSLRFTGGAVDATVDHRGRLVTEDGFADATMNLGSVEPQLQGTTMSLHETFDSHFYDYGAPISVSKPAHVSASSTLP